MKVPKRPSVSVCMATYNGAPFIRKQVDSILLQLNEGDELIVSDDYSSDETVAIIRGINDERIKIYLNNGEKGFVGNFQNALNKVSGELLFLADQDDIWHKNKIESMCKSLEKADLVLSDCRVVNSDGFVIHDSFFKYRKSKPGILKNLIKNSYIGCCMAFRRSTLSYILPIPKNVHMHDWWIGLMVEANGKVCFLNEITMSYIRHGSNASPTGEASHYSFFQRLQNRFVILHRIIFRLFISRI